MIELLKFSLFWTTANLAPILVCYFLKDNLDLSNYLENFTQTASLTLVIIFLEGYLIALTYIVFRKIKLIPYLLTATLILLHCISWSAFIRYKEFINPILDQNIFGFIFNKASWNLYIQNKDLLRSFSYFAAAIIFSFLLLKLIDLKKINKKNTVFLIFAKLILVIAFTFLPIKKATILASSNLSSQASLYLPLLFPRINKTYTSQKLNLVKRVDKSGVDRPDKITKKRNYLVILAEALRSDVIKSHPEFSPYLNSLISSEQAIYYNRAHSTATDSLSAFISVAFSRYPLLSEKGHWKADKIDLHQSLYSLFKKIITKPLISLALTGIQ